MTLSNKLVKPLLTGLILTFFIGKVTGQDTLNTFSFQTEILNDGWLEAVSYGGKFRVAFPGEVKYKPDTFQTDIGKLNYHVFYHEHFLGQGSGVEDKDKPGENLLFMLSIYEYPNYTIHSDSTEVHESYFKATIDGATQGVDGELIYTTDIQLNDFPGKMWRINYNNGDGVIRSRAFLIKKRLYLLSVVADRAFSMSSSNERFFESFEIFE